MFTLKNILFDMKNKRVIIVITKIYGIPLYELFPFLTLQINLQLFESL